MRARAGSAGRLASNLGGRPDSTSQDPSRPPVVLPGEARLPRSATCWDPRVPSEVTGRHSHASSVVFGSFVRRGLDHGFRSRRIGVRLGGSNDWRNHWRTRQQAPSKQPDLQGLFRPCSKLPKPRAQVRFLSGAFRSRSFVRSSVGSRRVSRDQQGSQSCGEQRLPALEYGKSPHALRSRGRAVSERLSHAPESRRVRDSQLLHPGLLVVAPVARGR